MRARPLERLLVCYVPALDLRDVAAGAFPYVAQLLSSYPSVRFRSQATTDQLTTLLTGTWPHEHGLWGPRLKPDWRRRTPVQRLIDLMPDLATSTGQCVRHALNGPIDLATMPPRRHRRFDWLRFNIKQLTMSPRSCSRSTACHRSALRSARTAAAMSITTTSGISTGCSRRSARATSRSRWSISTASTISSTGRWANGNRSAGSFAASTTFVAALHRKSLRRGLGFVLLSDHGMEPVDRVVDLRKFLRGLDLPGNSYDVFIENTKSHLLVSRRRRRRQDRRRPAIERPRQPRNAGGDAPLQPAVRRRQLRHAYFYAPAGATFFPNDFHQPLVSLVRTVSDRQQRQRLRIPWHQGDHGYLPDNECEIGFMVLAEDGYEVPGEPVALIDLAPTLLDLLRLPKPVTMKGRVALRPRRVRVA